jgi:hypothetical protein
MIERSSVDRSLRARTEKISEKHIELDLMLIARKVEREVQSDEADIPVG